MLLLNPYFARNIRWEWVNTEATSNDTTEVYLEAVRPWHPIFSNVEMISLDPYSWEDSITIVEMIDPSVGSGITSFIGGTWMGNGRLIARPVSLDMGWIAEWDAGVEFYEGAGQYAGGKRMLLSAGTQEIQYTDPVTWMQMTTTQGELNLTPEGLKVFRNAVAYLLAE